MTLDYEVTADDFVAFNLYHIRHSPAAQRQILIMRAFFSLLVIALSIGLIYQLDSDKQLSLVAFLAPLFD